MKFRDKEDILKLAGWALSLLCMIIGSYFVWPHIHVALLGIVLVYLGIRLFNFATWEEYKEKRIEFLNKLI